MYKTFFLLISLLSSFNFCLAQTPVTEEALVREAVWKYIDGRNNGDVELLTSAFHPTADLRYVKNDEHAIWPIGEYIGNVKPGRKHDCKSSIVFVDVLGTAAQAIVEIEYPNVKFIDYINLLKVEGEWIIAIKTFARKRIDPGSRVLFVLTSHEQLGDTDRKTGLHLGEVTHAYRPIHDAGYEIDFVSPQGGATRMYGMDLNDPLNLWFVQNPVAYHRFTHAMTPDQIDPTAYAAIYYVGGHGTMWDLPDHAELQSITRSIYESEGVVAGVCHGPSGLVNVKLSNGEYLVAGKQMTAFTDAEERAAGKEKVVPFLLETQLKERGATFSGADLWQEKVVVDGRLVTGQNPASANQLGHEIVKLLEQKE